MSPQPALIRALQNPACYDHPVTAVTVLETHISWVLLTGDWAYKIKKPVDLGFVDFSTLDRRRFFCREELRLNRRLAPHLYRDVVAIGGTTQAPVLDGGGEPIEYAVRMRQFPQDRLLDRLLARDAVSRTQIDRIAAVVAAFHGTIERANPKQPFGDPEQVHRPVRENFLQIEPLLPDADGGERLAALREWSDEEHRRHRETFRARKADGFIRECHGDLHLGNMAWVEDDVVIFDCLEFNEALRWIDVISECAFLDMDLEDRGRADLGRRFLNAYLQHTGDYAGLALLRYYRTYRALVRAKVAAIRAAQDGLDAAGRAQALDTCRGYLAFAARAAAPERAFLLLTHGLSGAGKTTVTQELLERLGAIRLRSDVERKRLFALAADEPSGSSVGGGIYTPEADRATYARLAALAETVLAAGHPVIVDATFLKRDRRAPFYALARKSGVPVVVLELHVPESVLRARIEARRRGGRDASEADLEVLRRQQAGLEPLNAEERAGVAIVTAHVGDDPARLAQDVREGISEA